MSENKEAVQVSIMGKRYSVLCPAEDVAALKQAADHLTQHMRRIQNGNVASSPERVAVMAALNLAHELLTERGDSLHYKGNVEAKMKSLSAAMDEVLITAPSNYAQDFNEGST